MNTACPLYLPQRERPQYCFDRPFFTTVQKQTQTSKQLQLLWTLKTLDGLLSPIKVTIFVFIFF
jgi:hypothetical protein